VLVCHGGSGDAYEAAAVELDDQWVFAGSQVLGNENTDFDFVVANLFVWDTMHLEAVEAGGRRCVVERGHCCRTSVWMGSYVDEFSWDRNW
jgi:hypothetical protein